MEDVHKLLIKLASLEEFGVWRSEICNPILRDIEMSKKEVLSMDEATIKSLIMYENVVKKLFYEVFDDAKEIEKQEQEQANTERKSNAGG